MDDPIHDDVSEEDVSRRRVLAGVVGAAGLSAATTIGVAGALRRLDDGGGAAGTAATTTTSVRAPAPAQTPSTGSEAPGGDPLLVRLRRSTFGVTVPLLAEVRDRGWESWLDEQLAAPVDDPELAERLSALETLTMTPADRLRRRQDRDAPQPDRELVHASLLRASESRWQVREVLVDHWHDHFHATLDVPGVPIVKADEDVAIRQRALGPFAELLRSVTRSPAMLLALDNATSRHPDPNENHARELLELHTVGVDGGFTEDDVRDTARVLTGWSIERDTGRFVFRPFWHDPGPKSVLGWATPGIRGADGVREGEELLDHLALLPATARHVTTRLVQKLVADEPPTEVIDAGVQAWTATDGSTAAVVRAVFDPGVFDPAVRAKVSRPVEAFTTMLRRLGGRLPADPREGQVSGGHDDRTRNVAVLVQGALAQLGQSPFRAPAPIGYPNVAAAWTSSHAISLRWRIAAGMAAMAEGLGVDVRTFAPTVETVGEAAAAITTELWLRSPTEDELTTLVDATGFAADDTIDLRTRVGLAGLALATGPAIER